MLTKVASGIKIQKQNRSKPRIQLWNSSPANRYAQSGVNSPRDGDISALSGDVYQTIVEILEAAAVNPDVSRIGFYLNPINVVSSPAFELEVADDDILAFLQSQTKSHELDPLAPAIDRLVRRHTTVGSKMNRPGNFEDDPERSSSPAPVTERSRTIICKSNDNREFKRRSELRKLEWFKR